MNSRTAFRRIVKESSSPYRLKNLYCSNHTAMSSQKQIAKAKNPRMVASSSSKVLGTSKDTTSSVRAKAKTASAKPSIRDTSWPRQENPSSPPIRLCANLVRSTFYPSPGNVTQALLGRVQYYPSHWRCCHRVFEALGQFCTGRGWWQFHLLVVHRTSQNTPFYALLG